MDTSASHGIPKRQHDIVLFHDRKKFVKMFDKRVFNVVQEHVGTGDRATLGHDAEYSFFHS